MNRRVRMSLAAMLALFSLLVMSERAAAACHIYFNNTTSGTTPYLTTTIVHGPFTVTACSPGVYSGTLTKLNAASMILQLEKQVSGTWTIVSSGNFLSYSGTTGTYRYTVRSTGNGNAQWSVDYQYPVQ